MYWLAIATIGLAVTLLNVWATSRLWRAGLHERAQLLAQTILMWLVPGTAIVVMLALRADQPMRFSTDDDHTADNPQSPNADAVNGTTGHDSL
jgi:hypothetical protein